MSISQAIQLIRSLPADLQAEVVQFVERLAMKRQPPPAETLRSSLAERRRRNRGRLKGMIEIRRGFDDPVEGFEAYAP